MEKKKALIVLIVFILAVIAGFFIFFKSTDKDKVLKPAYGGRYKEGIVGQPDFANPILHQVQDIDKIIYDLVFSSLLKKDNNDPSGIQLDLASKYELSQDKKSYVISLNEKALWHDGVKLTADDVLFTLDLARKSSSYNKNLEKVLNIEIEKIDNKTLKFICHSKEECSNLLFYLDFPILPKHILENLDPQETDFLVFNIKPIGSGPFVFQNIKFNQNGEVVEYSLKRNENFYLRPPYLEEIVFKFYPSFEQAEKALKYRSIDGLGFLPKDFNLPEIKGVNTYRLVIPQYIGLFFNLANSQSLVNQSEVIRQALALTVNKEQLPPVAQGMGFPLNTSIIEAYLKTPLGIEEEYDPEKAKEVLQESGWENNGEVWLKNNEQISFTILTSDQEIMKQVALSLQSTWNNFGFDVSVKAVPEKDLMEAIKNRDFEAIVYGVVGGLPTHQYAFWHSSNIESSNLTGFNDRKADELLELSEISLNKEEFLDYLKQFQKIISQEKPCIFLYSPYYFYLVRDNIKGIKLTNILSFEGRLLGVKDWYIKTEKVEVGGE
ncbi:hypothetical protein J7J60_02745 [bacterium]|nr:hypothetical protein [bacterium]